MKSPHILPKIVLTAILLGVLAAPSSATFTLRTAAHEKYLDGTPDGLFQPSASLTRAQAASIVYQLMEAPPETAAVLPDVPENAWYETAAGTLAGAGILPADPDGRFRPEDPITRAECAAMLSHFIPPAETVPAFSDVPAGQAETIAAAAAYGLFSADETGAFRPDAPLTRAETAVVFNRLLGRRPNAAELAATPGVRVFVDVPANHWAYAEILEASVTHDYAPLLDNLTEHWTSFVRETPQIADGFHLIDGWLYFARDGQYVVSQTVGSFTFGADGRYTTGTSALDAKLAELIRTHTDAGMSRDEKLRALHLYLRDNYTYIKRDLVSKGQTGWEPAFALNLFSDGRGNCFSFAAAYQQLARAIGVEADVIVGELGKNHQVHGWVEVYLDGETYIVDTELEMSYRQRGQTYDLFKFQYASSPFDYWK